MSLNKEATKFFTCLAVFSLPFQVFLLVLTPDWGLGFSNPYLTVNFYLFEFFTLCGLLFCPFASNLYSPKTKNWPYFFLFFLFFLIPVWLSNFELSLKLLMSFKFFSYISFFYLLSVQKGNVKLLLVVFLFSALIQSVFAILQFIFNGSLGLNLLGEPLLTENVPHLARAFGSSQIRAYGTFTHPNILAFFLSFALIVLHKSYKASGWLFWVSTSLLGLALLFTLSRVAIVLGLAVLLATHWKVLDKNLRIFSSIGAIVSVITLFILRPLNFSSASVTERILGLQISFESFFNNPLFGTGFRSFTGEILKLQDTPLMPWEMQPVHNVSALILSEFGLTALLLLCVLIFVFLKRNWRDSFKRDLVLFVIIFSLFEHFFLSLDAGVYLLCFCIFLTLNLSENQENLDSHLKSLLSA